MRDIEVQMRIRAVARVPAEPNRLALLHDIADLDNGALPAASLRQLQVGFAPCSCRTCCTFKMPASVSARAFSAVPLPSG